MSGDSDASAEILKARTDKVPPPPRAPAEGGPQGSDLGLCLRKIAEKAGTRAGQPWGRLAQGVEPQRPTNEANHSDGGETGECDAESKLKHMMPLV